MAEEDEGKKIEEIEDEKGLEEERPSDWFFRPLQEMDRMFEDLDKTFKQFFGEPLMRRRKGFKRPAFRSPAMNIKDEGDRYEINAEMPGIDKDDIEVEIRDDRVKISGETKEEKEEKEEDFVRRESGYRSFYRELPMGDEVISDEAEASYNNGVLEITLPKREKKKGKTLEIQ